MRALLFAVFSGSGGATLVLFAGAAGRLGGCCSGGGGGGGGGPFAGICWSRRRFACATRMFRFRRCSTYIFCVPLVTALPSCCAISSRSSLFSPPSVFSHVSNVFGSSPANPSNGSHAAVTGVLVSGEGSYATGGGRSSNHSGRGSGCWARASAGASICSTAVRVVCLMRENSGQCSKMCGCTRGRSRHQPISLRSACRLVWLRPAYHARSAAVLCLVRCAV